ncbi:BRCT protein [Coleophoma cylindrospora]|uniref:BRCT protein n=1 Tax=Coleophoma cylindrospora TaxID=1849047 RepID=A0A3D8QGJ9_9HELO|nr:BRCT protein [Coleophoma cylindrospora]
MPPPKAPVPSAAQPLYSAHFDAWNSSSTGHQRAENRLGGSTGWRQSRTMKLGHQFKSGSGGGKRIADSIGAGSDDWDEKAKALIPQDVRARAKLSVADMLMGKNVNTSEKAMSMVKQKKEDETREEEQSQPRGIFSGLVIYVNGSTHPTISDHRLKHVLAENGGRLSISLGRRQVTHVILGKPCGGQGIGAGGGLAGGKLEKEIRRVGGCGVKYVGVEWVMESMKAGKRLPEAQFSNLKVAAKGQQTVYDMFKKGNSSA